MSTQSSNEGEIRKALIEADLVDCMVALPGQLFFTTPIPVCLWFLSRNKKARVIRGKDKTDLPDCMRDRQKQTLFIDGRKMGVLVDRIHRELTEEEIRRIAETYHQWKLDLGQLLKEADKRGILLDLAPSYADVPGFCKSVKLEEIRTHDYVLTPGRYVGAAEVEDDGEPFEQRMKRLTATLEEQFMESAKLEKAIRSNMEKLFNSAN